MSNVRTSLEDNASSSSRGERLCFESGKEELYKEKQTLVHGLKGQFGFSLQ